MFGYVSVKLSDVAGYVKYRVSCDQLSTDNYVGVENLLQNKAGKKQAERVPTEGNAIEYLAGDVLIGNIRPYLKKIWLADSSGGTNGDVLVIRPFDSRVILPEFLHCVLSSEDFFRYATATAKGAKMPRGDKKAIMQYVFPLPPLAEQERIVSILDKFDALVTDLSSGLPAEIEACHKQYEYYRDKLLMFPEIQPSENGGMTIK